MPSESRQPPRTHVSPGLLELQQAGWLSQFHDHRNRVTILEALSCPDCGSDEVWVSEDDTLVRVLCGECRHKHAVSQYRIETRQSPEPNCGDVE